MRLALGLTHFKVGLLACFFLAIFSRFYLLADASLFRDEGHTIYVCQSWGRVWENLKGYPPLYWILEKTTLE